MNRRGFLRSLVATAAGVLVPAEALASSGRVYFDMGRRPQFRVVSIIHDSVIIDVESVGDLRALAKGMNFGWPNGGGILHNDGLLPPGILGKLAERLSRRG